MHINIYKLPMISDTSLIFNIKCMKFIIQINLTKRVMILNGWISKLHFMLVEHRSTLIS